METKEPKWGLRRNRRGDARHQGQRTQEWMGVSRSF